MNNCSQAPLKIKRCSTSVEQDPNVGSTYFFIPPFNHRKFSNDKISSSKSVKTSFGVLTFDFCGDKLFGVEIPNDIVAENAFC